MAKPKETKKTTKKPLPKYSLVVSVNGEQLSSSAGTLGKAVENLTPELPLSCKTKVIITYKKGKTELRRNLFPVEANRFFRRLAKSPSEQALFGARLERDLRDA